MLRDFIALAQKQDQAGYCLQSPAVGWVSELPAPNQILTTESYIGKITILSSTYRLKLPPNICGQVAQYDTELKIRPVSYAETLFNILPMQEKLSNEIFSNGNGVTCNCENGRWIVRAITDGIFYRRPSPDTAPYVEIGNQVNRGQVLGLVEVMKCFNKVIFDGTDFPSQASIREICAKDGEEVKYNQPLFIFA